MSQDEWKSSINSLTKDIEELRKELLTERVKNLPDMIQNMVKTARQDMEARLKEIQENIREERVLIDDRVAQTDNRLKEIDEIITRIEARDKRVGKFVDDYAGSLTEIKGEVKVLNDDLKKFQGEMRSKFNSINKEINKVTTFADQINSTIKRGFEVKREWGKVSTKFEKMEKVFKEVAPRLDKMEKENKKLRTWIAENRKNLEDIKMTSDEIFRIKDALTIRMQGIDEFRKEIDNIVNHTNEMLNKVEVNDVVINQFKDYMTNLNDTMKYFGEVSGKVSELEHYFKDPKTWLSESIDEFVKESMNRMENKVDSATSSLENARKYIRQEFVQILIISKLTEVANAEMLADMLSNMRSLEFLISEAIRMGIWNKELENGVINTLSSTRDFWDARKPDLSDVLQKSIDTIESQIKEV